MKRQISIFSAALAVVGLAVSSAAAANSVSGSALGVSASVTGVGTVAPNPTVTLPPGGGSVEGHVVALDAPGILDTGTLTADSDGTIGVNMATAISNAAVEQLDILNGLVTADGVLARASSTGDGATATSSAAGTTILGLTINGINLGNVTPAPNTVIPIPLIGSVILNEQVTGGDGITTSSLTVRTIHVVLNGLLGTADIVVAEAHSDVDFTPLANPCNCPVPPNGVSGEGYGLFADILNNPALDIEKNPRALLSSKGGSAEARLLAANVPGLVSTGTVDSTTSGTAGPLSAIATTRSVVEDLNLLGGLITADLIDARATCTGNGTTAACTDAGTTFVNLVVDGNPIAFPVAPNTMIPVAGVGTVILNEQVTGGDGTETASLTVNMIHVVMNGALTGDAIVVSAHADVDFSLTPSECNPCDDGNICNGVEVCDPELGCLPAPPQLDCSSSTGSVSGEAYGAEASVPQIATLARNPDAVLPAGGGNAEGHLVFQDVPGLITDGTITATTTGAVGSTSATATSRAEVEGLNVLSGLITADLVVAQATSQADGVTASSSAAGSTVVNLVIDSLPPINGTPPPNTVIPLPGIGTVILNEQIPGGNGTTTTSLTVNMIHVILSGGPLTGDIVVASAHSDASFTLPAGPCVCQPAGNALTGDGFGVFADLFSTPSLELDRNPRALLSARGGSAEGSAADLSVLGLLTTETVESETTGSLGASSATVSTRTVVEDLNALAGLITADVLDARCSSSGDGTTASSNSTGTTFANLVIDGLPPINVTPPPNTMIPLPGIGTVILNEQVLGGNGTTSSSMSVNLVHVVLNGLLGSGDVIVASASCGVQFETPIQGTCLPPPPNPCDDGDPCNGTEICDPQQGCLPGPPPPTVCGTTTTSSTTTTTTIPPAVCGNGIVEAPEQCDPPGATTCPTVPNVAPPACNPDCTCPPPCPEIAFLVRIKGQWNNGAEITGGTAANDPGGKIQLGTRAFVATGSDVVGDTVKLSSGTSVDDVFTNFLVRRPDSIIRGQTGPATLPITSPFCPISAFTCGGQDIRARGPVSVGPLAAGSYGRLSLSRGAVVVLGPGDFTFCGIRMGKLAALVTTGSTQTRIQVVGDVRVGNGGFLGPAAGTPTPALELTGRTVRVNQHAVLQAFSVAPSATLAVGRGGQVRGSVCAQQGRSDKHISMTCPP